MGRFWLQNRFLSLPLYFKLIALYSYPHPASNQSIVQKKNVQSQFLILHSKESVRNRQLTSPFFSWSLVCVRLLFLFRHLVKVLRTGALFDSGRTKVASQGRTTHWLFNQSNRSIDLNQLISAKRGNSSSSFCDERNIYIQRSLKLESKDRINRTAEGMKLRKSNYGGKS